MSPDLITRRILDHDDVAGAVLRIAATVARSESTTQALADLGDALHRHFQAGSHSSLVVGVKATDRSTSAQDALDALAASTF